MRVVSTARRTRMRQKKTGLCWGLRPELLVTQFHSLTPLIHSWLTAYLSSPVAPGLQLVCLYWDQLPASITRW